MNARFERRLARIERMKGGNPFDLLSDDELSALIETVKEHIDDDDMAYTAAIAQSLHWSVERAETFLADTTKGERWRI